MGGGFKINNPNASSSCGCGESFAWGTTMGIIKLDAYVLLISGQDRYTFLDGLSTNKVDSSCSTVLTTTSAKIIDVVAKIYPFFHSVTNCILIQPKWWNIQCFTHKYSILLRILSKYKGNMPENETKHNFYHRNYLICGFIHSKFERITGVILKEGGILIDISKSGFLKGVFLSIFPKMGFWRGVFLRGGILSETPW